MQKTTKTATVSGRRHGSAPSRYRCKAWVKPDPTRGGPAGTGLRGLRFGINTKCRDPPPVGYNQGSRRPKAGRSGPWVLPATHGGCSGAARRGVARDRGPTKRSLFLMGSQSPLRYNQASPWPTPARTRPHPGTYVDLGPTDETHIEVRRPGSARSEISNPQDGHI